MKKVLSISLLAVAAIAASNAHCAPTYLPFGPQGNVSESTVTSGGWTECYAGAMSLAIGNAAESVLTPCQGEYLMMAGRATGSSVLMSLAAALRSDTIFETGDTSTTHLANGSQWWFSDQWSWGYTAAGDTVQNNQCDVGASPTSLCLHTFDWVGGYRINDIVGLNDSGAYEKVFFVAGEGVARVAAVAAVPEPASIALVGLALAAAGFTGRRSSANRG